MRKLSDYEGEEAFELWADLLDPLSEIMTDDHITEIVGKGTRLKIATEILRTYKKETEQILLRIDPEPINGLTVVIRLVSLITEIGEQPEIAAFFGYAEQVKTAEEPSGSATETTKASVK